MLVGVPKDLFILGSSGALNRHELATSYVVDAVADATFPGKIKGN